MTSDQLENLLEYGYIKEEDFSQDEFNALVLSGRNRLKDARNPDNSFDSRFDLAYNAAHALSLAALRKCGYRPDKKRYIVFQVLPHTLGLPTEVWRVLVEAHRRRNQVEYDAITFDDEQFQGALIEAAEQVLNAIDASDSTL